MLFTNPTLTAADYLRLNKSLRELNKEMSTEVQLKRFHNFCD